MINLEWLRTFSYIYECNNITEAAKKLNMTQPGVSKHLSALESHIGKKLFERTTRKLAPTEYGKFLYVQINNPLQELKKVEHYSNQRAKKKRSTITIGCTTDFLKKELLHKIYAFDMYIVTHFGSEKELIEALEADKIQLLIGIKKHSLYEHQFTLFNNEDLTLISSNNIHIPKDLKKDNKQVNKWLNKQTWFTYDNAQEDIKKFWNAQFNTIPKIIPRYVLPSYSAIIIALQTNPGFSIVPKHLCDDALNNGMLKSPLKFSKKVTQKRFYSYKLKDNNLKEISLFMAKMKNPQEPN